MINKRHVFAGIDALAKPLKVRHLPIHIQLEPIQGCNLKCITCGGTRDFKYMDFRTYSKIVSEINPLNITLSGFGEPLMHPEIFRMIKYAEERGTSINLTVNGTFLNEKTAEKLVSSRLSLLSISLDAAKKETYEKIRLGADFKKVMNGIKSVNRAKAVHRSNLPKTRAQFVMTRMNLKEMNEFISLSADLEADAIYFQPLCLNNSKRSLLKTVVGDLCDEELLTALKQGLHHARDLGISTNLNDLINKFPMYWKKYTLEQQNGNRRCIMPWFSTFITLEGDVVVCCSLGKYASMGNLFEQDFRSIWNNDRYKKIRKLFKDGKRPYNICKHCIPLSLSDIIIDKEKFTPGFLKLLSRTKKNNSN